MISMLTVNGKHAEFSLIKDAVSDVAARLTEDFWNTKFFENCTKCKDFLKNEPLIDFGCCDVTLDGMLELLPEIRKGYEQMGIILIADVGVSPVKYLKPGIRADALLLRPLTTESIKEGMEELVISSLKNRECSNNQDAYVIDSKEGKTILPYDRIFYFEAREKKIFVRLKNEEYGFYSTMEELSKQLPEYFLRCHRSYIINMGKIRKILGGQNMVELESGFSLPFSRSYKHSLMSFESLKEGK